MLISTSNANSDPAESISVYIRCQPVELYKILKFEGLAGSGAEAKGLIDDGLVSVNGELEYRRRRKIIDKDVFEYDGLKYRVIVDANC